MPSVICSHCGKTGKIPDAFVGKRIKCKECGNSFLALEQPVATSVVTKPQAEAPSSGLSGWDSSPEVDEFLPKSLALEHFVVPLKVEGKKLYVAFAESAPKPLLEKLAFIANKTIVPVIARQEDVQQELNRRYPATGDVSKSDSSSKPATLPPPLSKRTATTFECSRPVGDGRCSDDTCPCGQPGALIPPGTGYLYITREVVDFRKDAVSESAAQSKIQQLEQSTKAKIVNPQALTTPVLMCKRAAERRAIDMEVAAEDARSWWKTGQVPLRETPTAPKQVTEPELSPEVQAREEKVNELVTRCIVRHLEKTGEFISNAKSAQWTAGVMRLKTEQVEKLLSDKKAFEKFLPILAANPGSAWAVA